MNIFVTDNNPIKCAERLDDKRVVKMVLESAQMLSTAVHYHHSDLHASLKLYKPTHVNHPCNVWCRQTNENYIWLLRHLRGLANEYNKRYGKEHKCVSLFHPLTHAAQCLPEGKLTPFANCARNKDLGIDYTSEADVFKAYQLYLNDRWDTDKREPTWYGLERE